MNAIHHKLALSLVAVAASACGTAWADPAATSCCSVTGTQRSIVERADESMDALRGYVRSRTVVTGIDMQDVRGSLDTWRAAVTCQKQVAAAKASADELAKASAERPDVVLSASR